MATGSSLRSASRLSESTGSSGENAARIARIRLFTGAGRLALDHAAPWGRRPVPFGPAGLALAVVTSAAVLLLFHG